MRPSPLAPRPSSNALRGLSRWALVAAIFGVPKIGLADVSTDRASAAGYFRVMTRPDYPGGGDGALGYWNLYGRLLNEGPYAKLFLQLQMLQTDPSRDEVWANVSAQIEGGSITNVDNGNGNLVNYRVSNLFVKAGNLLLKDVTWRVGTLDYWPGDLGLYDMRPAEIFYDTVGASAFYQTSLFDLLVGVGDAGYAIRGFALNSAALLSLVGSPSSATTPGSGYDTIYTGGVWSRFKPSKFFEVGLGGQGYFEPPDPGNPNAPYQTPGVTFENYYRQQVVQQFFLDNPEKGPTQFPNPVATSADAYRAMWYLGFGNFGPIVWNSLYGNYAKKFPQNSYEETYNGLPYTIYVHDLTDQRYGLVVGDELQFHIVPNLIDGVWSFLYGQDRDHADTIAANENNRNYMSTVLRLQVYLTERVHFLLENSLAQEHSLNGNLWREHVDSIFNNSNGVPDVNGLQYGDSDDRNTWQGKAGLVFNPGGRGIFNRPSLRLLYGLQYSNQQDAWGNDLPISLAQYNQFPPVEHHWHQVISLEAEAWF